MLLSRLLVLSLLLTLSLALLRPARMVTVGRAIPSLSPLAFSSTAGTQEPQLEDSDEALIMRISEEVMAESGVELDQLINPSKVGS